MSKIAFLSFYSGFVERVVETYVCELGTRLAKKHEVTVFQGGKSHLWYGQAKIDQNNFKVNDINSIGSGFNFGNTFLRKFYLDWWSLKILLFSLKAVFKVTRGKYDLVVPMNGGWQTVIYRLLSKFRNFKILISAQAGIGRDDAWNLFWKPDIFVALTKVEEKWANRFAPEVKKTLIPNGVDLFKFNPKVSPKKLALKAPIVVCAADFGVKFKKIYAVWDQSF